VVPRAARELARGCPRNASSSCMCRARRWSAPSQRTLCTSPPSARCCKSSLPPPQCTTDHVGIDAQLVAPDTPYTHVVEAIRVLGGLKALRPQHTAQHPSKPRRETRHVHALRTSLAVSAFMHCDAAHRLHGAVLCRGRQVAAGAPHHGRAAGAEVGRIRPLPLQLGGTPGPHTLPLPCSLSNLASRDRPTTHARTHARAHR
jgi:hypothetical protein